MKLIDIFENQQPSFINIDEKNAFKIMQKHCSDAMWMFEKETPIWRGMTNLNRPVTVVNTTKTVRKSAIISNHYTVLIDNNPANADYPKRSRSLICTTNKSYAKTYANRHGSLYAIIPFNGTPIGEVRDGDIWNKRVSLDGYHSADIDYLNRVYTDLGIDDNIEAFKEYDRKLKVDKELVNVMIKMFDERLSIAPAAATKIAANFYDTLMQAYSAKELGFALSTTKTLASRQQEVWVGGNCLVLSEEAWHDMLLNNSLDLG